MVTGVLCELISVLGVRELSSPNEIDLIGLEILINQAEEGSGVACEFLLAFSERVHGMTTKLEMLRRSLPPNNPNHPGAG